MRKIIFIYNFINAYYLSIYKIALIFVDTIKPKQKPTSIKFF